MLDRVMDSVVAWGVLFLVIIILLDYFDGHTNRNRQHETQPILPSTTQDTSILPPPRVTPPNGSAVNAPALLARSYGATDASVLYENYTRRLHRTSVQQDSTHPTSYGGLPEGAPRRTGAPGTSTRDLPQPQRGPSVLAPRYGPHHSQERLSTTQSRLPSLQVPSPSVPHASQCRSTQSSAVIATPYSLASSATAPTGTAPQQLPSSRGSLQHGCTSLSDPAQSQPYAPSAASTSQPQPQRESQPTATSTQSSPKRCIKSHSDYEALRKDASKARALMEQCFSERNEAQRLNQTHRAGELTRQGESHQAKMTEYNREASAWIYNKNNENRGFAVIDLHNLYVKEAIDYTDLALSTAALNEATTMRLIVGRGKNSKDGVPRIKPEVEKHLNLKCKNSPNMNFKLDPRNEGVFLVTFGADSATKQSANKGKKRRKNENTDPASQAGSSSSKRARRETT